MSDEYWPEYKGGYTSGVGPWWCGACGGLHGWDCPYFGGPGKDTKPTSTPGQAKLDREAGVGPFRYGPNPGGLKKKP